jgi:hypothetical protein
MLFKSIKQILRTVKYIRQINDLVNNESTKSTLENIELIRQGLNDISTRIQLSSYEPHKSYNASEPPVAILSSKMFMDLQENLRNIKEIASIIKRIIISSSELINELKLERDLS